MNRPRKFVTLPVVVEAMQVVGTPVDRHKVYSWMLDNGYPPLLGNALEPRSLYDPALGMYIRPTKGVWIDPSDGSFMIRTPDGDMKVEYGDWVIRGITGDFYTCKTEHFYLHHKLSEDHD